MDPITIPLSVYQRQQLAELRAAAAQAKRDEQTILKTVIGAQHAPGDPVWQWHCTINADALVLSPPQPSVLKAE